MPITTEMIVQIVGAGGFFTRLDIARALKRGKTTHLISMIEKAAQEGKIQKSPGFDSQGRAAWVYCTPDWFAAYEPESPF